MMVEFDLICDERSLLGEADLKMTRYDERIIFFCDKELSEERIKKRKFRIYPKSTHQCTLNTSIFSNFPKYPKGDSLTRFFGQPSQNYDKCPINCPHLVLARYTQPHYFLGQLGPTFLGDLTFLSFSKKLWSFYINLRYKFLGQLGPTFVPSWATSYVQVQLL